MSLTVVQISDLHFGPSLVPDLSLVKGNWPPHTFQGFAPHDPDACTALSNAIQRISPRKDCVLLVSGDLTASGDTSEFACALTYLHELLRFNVNMTTGLRERYQKLLSIPGNHDHWAGRTGSFAVRGGPAYIHGTYFDTSASEPWWITPIPIPSARSGPYGELCLIGIDTCARASTQWMAKGYVDPSHLKAISARLQRRNSSNCDIELRALVVHHSFAPDGLLKALHEYDKASMHELKSFIAANNIKLVFSGLTHKANQIHHSTGFNEVRCGTTLQLQNPQRVYQGQAYNEFLSHNFSVNDDGNGPLVILTTKLHRRRFSGFQHADTWTSTFR